MTLNLIVSALKRYRKCFLSFAHQSFFLLSVIDLPWIVTGVFVYQSFISESKMWAIYTIPKAFMVYSITSIATLFVSGFLVDKFTGRKLIMYMNIPLLFAMITLFYFNHEIFAYVFV